LIFQTIPEDEEAWACWNFTTSKTEFTGEKTTKRADSVLVGSLLSFGMPASFLMNSRAARQGRQI